MALPGKIILGINVLRSYGTIAGVIVVNAIWLGIRIRNVIRVGQDIGPVLCLVTVVILVVLIAVQVGTGVDHINITDTAIERQ